MLNDHVESVVVVKAELGALGVQIGKIDKIEKLPTHKIEPLPKMIRAVIRLNSIWGMGIVNEGNDQANDSGDIINLLDLYGSSIATGISNYGSTDIELIMGLQSDQITDTLGHQYGAEIVHRSNLVKL